MPLRNGDTDEGLLGSNNAEMFAGHYFMRAKTKQQPGVVNRNRKPLMPPDEIYSGAYAIASCARFTYEYAGKKGVSLLLNNVMKTRDGERISGRKSAEEDFANVEVPGAAASDNDDIL
jgi:hypothetical protein